MESTNFMVELLRELQRGDLFLVLIAFTFGIAIAFSLERLYRLFVQYNIDGTSFMFDVQKFVLANDIDGAIRACNGASKTALARVIKAGLQRASREDQQIQNAIDAASLEVIPKLEKRINYLALIANISTLLGLLGTISGLIAAFAALKTGDAAQRQELLAIGISQAMHATAFGLIVAIFSMVMHSILSNKANSILEEIDEFGVKLLDLLSARKTRG